jgi:hypothetical protein
VRPRYSGSASGGEPPRTVGQAVQLAVNEQATFGGQLGSLRSTRRKVYERLKRYREHLQARPTLFTGETLRQLAPAFDALIRFPLKESARDSLGRQLRLGMTDEELAEMVIWLYEENRLSVVQEEAERPEPQIVCSLGLQATD